MKIQKGKRESVEGPVKGFFYVVGFLVLLIALGAFLNGAVGVGFVWGGIGAGIIAIASRFRNKTRITY